MKQNFAAVDETLWVPDADQESGFGCLETARGRLPLAALDVRANVIGLTSHVTIRQTFRNAFDEPLEATYIFPLPDRAAVTSFKLRVAGRTVEGVLRERGEARREYDQAIQSGHRAAIGEEERSGVFTMRVGNLPPHEEATAELTLVGPLVYVDGEAEFRFPLVVAPRYAAGEPLDGPSVGAGTAADTDQVPDASRVTPPVLLPGFPNPVRLSLEVGIDLAGHSASRQAFREKLRCSLHSAIEEQGADSCCLRLQPGERLNRDFVLRFPASSETVEPILAASPPKNEQPGVFALTVVPPRMNPDAQPKPRDVAFVLDRSGSMDGWKMVAARRALGRMIDSLLDQDRFTVVAFDTVNEVLPAAEGAFINADDRGRWKALEWLGKIDARGGTDLAPALQLAASSFQDSEPERERIIVLVTDGQVGGEDSVLRSFQKTVGKNMPRVFALGIDRAVNAGFLKRLASLGDGACDLVESEDRLDEVMDRVHRAIGLPALTDVTLEPMGFDWVADSMSPSRIPDVFAGRPITIHGRFKGYANAKLFRGSDATGEAWEQ
ncbi:MAG: VIT domain-containing protein [Planctomycetales bacterium]